MKIRLLLNSIFLLFIFYACTTTIPVKVRKPAELNIGSARTVAVMDFDFSGNWDFGAGEQNNTKLKKAIAKALSQGHKKLPDSKTAYPGSKVSDQLVAKLVQNQYYTVIERSKIEEILKEQSLSLSGLVSEEQAVSVGNLIGAQALITGSGSYSVKDEGGWEKYTVKEKNSEGKKVDVEKERYAIYRLVNANMTFRIIDVNTGSIIASKTNSASNQSYKKRYMATGNNEEEAAKGLPDWNPIVTDVVGSLTDQIVMQIAPHTIVEKREIEEGESNKMETALEYAKRDLWDEAKVIWENVLKTKKSEKEDKIAATYNLGLYYEVFGFLDDAENYYQAAYKLSKDSKYLDARARINRRREELKKLQQQEYGI
jgi:curli biogenesis system outer membrane secretion channel CsgG